RSVEVGAIEEAFADLRCAGQGSRRRDPVPPLPFAGALDPGPPEKLFPEIHSALAGDNRCGGGGQGCDARHAEIPEDERGDGGGRAGRQAHAAAPAAAGAGRDDTHAAGPRGEVIWMLTVGVWMLAVSLLAQDRPGLFFREDWKETPPETPVTQEHVANPELVLSLHGPGKAGIRKSHHDKPADDPYYVWMGECPANCALSLRRKSGWVDMTGFAKIRWRAKQTGFRELHPILKLADGTWLIANQSDGPSEDWRVREFNISDIRWRRLD